MSKTGKDTPKKRRRYTKEFKRDAVGSVIRSGKSAAEVARELGISETLLAGWVRKGKNEADEKVAESLGRSPSELADEIRQLRRELDHVSEQRDILKKALGILSSTERERRSL